jgi:hypothetical protein
VGPIVSPEPSLVKTVTVHRPIEAAFGLLEALKSTDISTAENIAVIFSKETWLLQIECLETVRLLGCPQFSFSDLTLFPRHNQVHLFSRLRLDLTAAIETRKRICPVSLNKH